MRTLLLGTVLLVSIGAGCGGPRQNAELLVFSVRALRDAPNLQKAERLRALHALTCDTRELCEFKARCATAYDGHVAALAQIDEIKGHLPSPVTEVARLDSTDQASTGGTSADNFTDSAEQNNTSLNRAVAQLARARELARECVLHEAGIVTAFKL